MNIGIVGYGKMGKKIEELAISDGHAVSLIIDQFNSEQFFDSNLIGIDVIIEFSTPDAAFENIMHSLKVGVPIISGTTGWLQKKHLIEDFIAKNGGAFLYASNFSIGMNLFFQINQFAAKLMEKWGQYNVHIEETHHSEKLDQPSGTAISLGEQILDVNPNFQSWVNENSSKNDELSILSHRVADNPGKHEIIYSSDADIIELKHHAKNRDGFAKGALLAAAWIQGKNGVFSMKDVILNL